MSTFSFKGVSSDTLGLIVKKTPVPPVSMEEYSVTSIPDGPNVRVWKGTRKNIQIRIDCTVVEEERLRDIYAALQGQGKLILSSEPDKYYYAVCSPVTPENIVMYMNNLSLSFDCEPYAYGVEQIEETFDLTETSSACVHNQGTALGHALYEITTTGDIHMWHPNGYLKIETGADTVKFDTSERMVRDSDNNIILNKVKSYTGDFALNPGDNAISFNDDVQSVKITRRERWI